MPAPKRANTAPATAARLAKMAKRAHERRVIEAIDLLRADGFTVTAPVPTDLACPDCPRSWGHPLPCQKKEASA